MRNMPELGVQNTILQLFRGSWEYPSLSILTDKQGCVVNYFSMDNTCQFASIGDMEKEGTEEFLDGQYEVASYQIISKEKALECALEFYDTHQRPDCIEWEAL